MKKKVRKNRVAKRKKPSQKKPSNSTGALKKTRLKPGYSIINDPMAERLEEIVRPRLLQTRRTALLTWFQTMNHWVEEEVDQSGYDTERLERLIECAWERCCNSLRTLDSRYSFQAIRSLPLEVIDIVGQLFGDIERLKGVLRLMTAAALASGSEEWDKSENASGTSIVISPEKFEKISDQLPDLLGECIGASLLLYEAQGWYRWAGKGKQIKHLPIRMEPEQLNVIEKTINQWDGKSIFLMSAVEFHEETSIEKAVQNYEARRDAAQNYWFLSGLIGEPSVLQDNNSYNPFWHTGLRNIMMPPIPVHVPKLKLTFPRPSWYPISEFELKPWIDQLRPFEIGLKVELGLDCNQLEVCLTALGLVVARQSQCCYLKPVTQDGVQSLLLSSPAVGEDLSVAVSHLASIFLRGTLRVSVAAFKRAIVFELSELGQSNPEQIAKTFLEACSGRPEHHGLPKPILFYVLDPLTCILDLSLLYDFANACLALATSGEGGVANTRGKLFEEQVRSRLTDSLTLETHEIPWAHNRDIWDKKVNLGDVDFCFLRAGVLYNLDMKSWRRTSDYHIGHHHTILNRQVTLVEYLKKVKKRGQGLKLKLENDDIVINEVQDFLIVPFPEYLAPDQLSLWNNGQPKVITVDELINMVRDLSN